MSIEHVPVMRCTRIEDCTPGYLCSCGRTIVGKYLTLSHFGKPYEDLKINEDPTKINVDKR